MGCGASKGAGSAGEGTEEVQPISSSSITQIRDIAPPEVADTGAHPPRRDDRVLRRSVHFRTLDGAPLAIPGVIPDSDDAFSSRRGESLIKMHPPKKPQRLGLGLEAIEKKNATIKE